MVCRAPRTALTIGFPLRESDFDSRGAAGALFAFARWCTSCDAQPEGRRIFDPALDAVQSFD